MDGSRKNVTRNHRIRGPKVFDANGMVASDLGRMLGDRSLGHRILTGQRELSKAHIRILAERFALNPGALLR